MRVQYQKYLKDFILIYNYLLSTHYVHSFDIGPNTCTFYVADPWIAMKNLSLLSTRKSNTQKYPDQMTNKRFDRSV